MTQRRLTHRRTAAAALAAAAGLALTGCGGGGDDEAGGVVELTFANFYTGPDIDTVNAMVQAFNEAHPDIVVTNEAILGPTLETELPSLVASGGAYDIVATNDYTHSRLVAAGAIAALDEASLAEVGIEEASYFPNIWELGTQGGELYGVPFGATAAMMFSNQTLLSELGVEVPTTYDELVEAGTVCTTDTSGNHPGDAGFDGSAVDTYGLGISSDFAAPIGVSILAQHGGALWDAAGDVAFNSDAGLGALETLDALQTTDQISPYGITYEADLANFKAGKSCFMISGAWELKGLLDSGLDVGVHKVPMLGSQQASWGGAAWLGFPVQPDDYAAEKRDAALEFISWATGAEGSLMWTESGNLPARPDVAQGDEYAENPTSVVAQDLEELYIPAGVPWVGQVSDAWAEAYTAVLANGADPATQLAASADTAQLGVDDARNNYPEFDG